uniref:CD40 ligand n=1 Tax=Monopterus albus TaxID=43700 RepID=UPI0009B310F5|nr:tumor necrosis factor ligand superfamily member 6-like [Monopterus albus]
MINTYHTSVAPPPVPPRLNRSTPVLFPAPLAPQGHNRPLIRFLVGVVVLHLLMSVAGFIYLYQTGKMEKSPSSERQAASLLSEKQENSYRTLARMVVEHKKTQSWDMTRSVQKNINYYRKSWLTIQQPGDYYVYSRVTFSKGDPKIPLASIVKLRKNETGKETTVMQAYCNLDSTSSGTPRLCTATQGEVLPLEKGNQLSVWVQNISLVNLEDGATTFGMYKL